MNDAEELARITASLERYDAADSQEVDSSEYKRLFLRQEQLRQKLCKHEGVGCELTFNRMEDTGRFQADVKIHCLHCGVPFRFIGLPCGVDLNGAAVSVDGTEGRFAVAPKGQVVTPLDSTECGGFTVRKVK